MGEEEAPKIIIDEGWKAQVEREREEAAKVPEVPEVPEGDLAAQLEEAGLSPFDYLVSTFAAQTMMALGLVAEEDQQKVIVDMDTAHHLIDTLMMLKEKTAGNLTEKEDANLSEAISELQRVFAVRAQQASEASLNKPGMDPNPPFLDR